MSQSPAGIVASYNADRGFGFIKPNDGGEDYFVRFTEIAGGGYRSLDVGQRVRFEPFIEPGTGARQALKVHPET
jgi:CspA family cold shock protein